eukprot:8740171-Karenia_brevis.AAC.1
MKGGGANIVIWVRASPKDLGYDLLAFQECVMYKDKREALLCFPGSRRSQCLLFREEQHKKS